MADMLKDFDMVLAITQNAINAELWGMHRKAQAYPKNAFFPTKVDWRADSGEIKAELGATSIDLNPANNNSRQAVFILPLTSGTFTEYHIDHSTTPPSVKEVNHTIDNWQIAFNVDLQKMKFDEKARTTAKVEGSISDTAHQALTSYKDNLFSIEALVLDFASLKVIEFDVLNTKLPGIKDQTLTNLTIALEEYFKTERKKPYIIGIQIASKDAASTAKAVAPSLVPTGISFETTPSSEGLSTLNYLTNTGGHAAPSKIADGIFQTPFVTDNKSSGKLLISRASFFENFILRNLGQHLGAAFSTSNPLVSVLKHNTNGRALNGNGVHSAPTIELTTTATLSTKSPEIEISGTIAVADNLSVSGGSWPCKSSGNWKVWRNRNFTAKITIAASRDSHSLALNFQGFKFGTAYAPHPDQNDISGPASDVVDDKMMKNIVDGALVSMTDPMIKNQAKLFDSAKAAVPKLFVPPTGAAYSLAPQCFNASGDLEINVNTETV